MRPASRTPLLRSKFRHLEVETPVSGAGHGIMRRNTWNVGSIGPMYQPNTTKQKKFMRLPPLGAGQRGRSTGLTFFQRVHASSFSHLFCSLSASSGYTTSLVQRLTSALKKHTIRVLPIKRLTRARRKHTIRVLPIKRLASARRKHTIRVLPIQRLTSARRKHTIRVLVPNWA